MTEPFQLVTNCTFKGKDYLVQMCVLNSKKLELVITDKLMAEDWQCEYDASYIEALAHKTGNFKQFDVFVMMLKSGLLKTSDCITLDLLTLEDLEQLRCKKVVNSHASSRSNQSANLNKRYLILTYTVEFDRIHYPLPLDYCGPPDPIVLQNNIRRLESEIERLKQKNNQLSKADGEDYKKLKEKIQTLVDDNAFLSSENHRLNKIIAKKNKPGKSNLVLQCSLKKLEEQIIYEKNHNQKLILKLKSENKHLKLQVEELKRTEKELKMKLREASRYNFLKGSRRPQKNIISRDNSLDRKRSYPEQIEKQFFCRPVASWNSPSTSKFDEIKTLKKSQNRFLSSSSSDSEKEISHRGRSREKKQALAKENLGSRKSSRQSSNERSKHSSVDSKKKLLVESCKVGSKRSSSREGNSNPNLEVPQARPKKTQSRESSLSSRASSKQSKLSKHSNRGSGDHKSLKSRQTLWTGLKERENNLKFSMSDLETRIHALQKLLSEGLNF